jgi:outer membrane protein TolC
MMFLSRITHHALCIIAFSAIAQDLYLPPLPQLEASLTTFIEIERDAKLRAFDELKSSDWKDILPSVGIAYTPSGDPRPAASWSPLQIFDRKEQKTKRKMDRESIYLSYEILMTDRLYKLRQMYQDYMIDWEALKLKSETLQIDEQLYAITCKKYEENIIKPSEYLQAKKSILSIRADIKRQEQELLKRKNEVLYEAKWN